MKGGKDDGKPMDPLFPRLHINDADKGGPRPPPRNKMALCEQYNVHPQSSKLRSGPIPMLPLPPTNGSSSFVSQASSSNVGIVKRKVLPTGGSMSRSAHFTERYYSYCSGGVISNAPMTNSEPWMSAPANYQNPYGSASLMTKPECNLVQPRGFSNYNNYCTQNPGDGSDIMVPSFLQSGKALNYGNLQLQPDKGKLPTFSSISSHELHDACLKLAKETRSGDQTTEHHKNLAERNSRLSQNNDNCYEKPLLFSSIGDQVSSEKKISEVATSTLQPNQHKKISFGDERSTLGDPYTQPRRECKILPRMKSVTDVTSGMPQTATRKRCATVMDDSSHSSPLLGDCNEPTKIQLINEFSEDKDSLASQVGNADKKQNTSETSMEDSVPGLDLTPEDVASVIGQRLFWKARKTIVHQQRIFSLQIFELHRLIKVQRVIAGSPETLHENNFHPNKSSIQFPPINKLLYVTPLDPLPAVAKPEADALKSNLGKDCGAEAVSGMLPLPTSIAEIGRLPQQLIPKPLPTPVPIPTDAKLAPWCFQPPPGNQWLVPVKSPSEGLIYKPYTGPCFPQVGFMAPVYGNCTPISLSTMGGTTYGVPAPNDQGIGHFYGTSLGQGYFQPYPMPLINASGPNPEVEQMISSARVQLAEPDKDSSTSNANFAVPCQSPCKASSQQSAVVSGCGGNLHRHKGSDGQCSSATSPAERLEGEALSLFPTTPSSQALRDQSKVKVIKVVPHNRKSAPESAARIFQSIQEERKKHE
ncbi:UNVERIFIED_CONTAM: protein HEADING DATE 3B [Sesamum calycinum]|uniref:Protein HEADING DATE 3B n=1 Tax=Sesamum calycinum TaxID=2727403 RepID=A0AAW2SXS8_9LAMI